jgi:hypothetical protein
VTHFALNGLQIFWKVAAGFTTIARKIRRIDMNRLRTNSVLVLGLLICLSVPQLLFAGQPVDPSTLTPPLAPQSNPVCEKDGNQTICTVQFSDPPFAGGSGVICGTGATAYEVFQFQNRSVIGKRYYDQNGNLTRRHFREILSGTFSNPLTHAAVSFDGKDTRLHDLTIPGDSSTGTVMVTGSFHIYLAKGGTVLFEAGRTIEAADGSALISESGPHPFADYFVFGNTAAVQPLCDALQ